ncbi:unnamed protein product [Rotaria sp. Silwood1]|nr:unnamed protein product [Rotaria sp. Silwood1]CAF3458187.1 unnamed protein product [Rotaria sp. Silwood1]CAF3500141.1 unnamed protein product [Rotaria sp. Silwood1]CAF4602343.1 unnamed protein product [Rotaria sp. Silwood1]CAF4652789.1 unnamed protein product [Rotaria sp. Silwood1]
MSETNRPTSRWSSSIPTRIKSSNTNNNQTIPLIISRRKLLRTAKNHQQTFAQRMAKVRHDTEELFQLYYSNNIKFDTFQQQIVTGTRIRCVQTPSPLQNHAIDNTIHASNSRHCVSREQMSPLEICNYENQISNNESKQSPVKRTVQVRIDNNPMVLPSTPTGSTRSSSPTFRISVSSTSNLNTLVNSSLMRQDEFNESSIIKKGASLGDISIDSFENNNTKTNKATNDQRSLSAKLSLTTLSTLPSSTSSLINNRKDPINISYSSFSTINSIQQQNPPHVVTGTAVTAHQRSSSRPKPRPKSSMTMSTNSFPQQSNIKASPLSSQSTMSDFPAFIGSQRVVSIPSKSSRYVLVTFPQAPVRYHAPTHVERLLLPERFPTLFHNIVHSYEHNRNNK